jgi:copper(I)-binding protein
MRQFVLAALIAAFAQTAQAHDGVHIEDPYARVSSPNAASGAIFLTIVNHATTDERLLSVASDVAQKVQLHTHNMTADGVMQMIHVEEGFVIPGSGTHALDRGGDHIMLLGLTRSLKPGDIITLTLTFEKEGEVTIEVPVNNDVPADGGHGDNKHGHATSP